MGFCILTYCRFSFRLDKNPSTRRGLSGCIQHPILVRTVSLFRCVHACVSIFHVLAFPLARSVLDFCFPLALFRSLVIFLSLSMWPPPALPLPFPCSFYCSLSHACCFSLVSFFYPIHPLPPPLACSPSLCLPHRLRAHQFLVDMTSLWTCLLSFFLSFFEPTLFLFNLVSFTHTDPQQILVHMISVWLGTRILSVSSPSRTPTPGRHDFTLSPPSFCDPPCFFLSHLLYAHFATPNPARHDFIETRNPPSLYRSLSLARFLPLSPWLISSPHTNSWQTWLHFEPTFSVACVLSNVNRDKLLFLTRIYIEVLQGGEDSQEASSCRLVSAK